jgi:hypothetical protein
MNLANWENQFGAVGWRHSRGRLVGRDRFS